MEPLSDRLRLADNALASYAVKHGSGLGRVHPESDDATRFPFQRDRDRIIHTQAFRRLKHKTQVFVAGLRPDFGQAVSGKDYGRQAGHGDHYRTRITHTLEVAQIGRDLARTLGLNEDLAEAIALAHDLGHTPFGHAGEEAMNACLMPYQKKFEHNEQSLRIVTVLEDRTSAYSGLNLSQEILEGLMKHRTPHDTPDAPSIPRSASLEAQIVNLADEIAYTAHDTDDGLRAEQFSLSNVQKTRLGFLASKRAEIRSTELRGAIVDALVVDLYRETDFRLKQEKILTIQDVYAARKPLVSFSREMQTSLTELRGFLWDHLYKSDAVQAQAKRGQNILTELFAAFLESPPPKVLELQKKTDGALEDAVKDYIAGMTDPYALQAYEGLKESRSKK